MLVFSQKTLKISSLQHSEYDRFGYGTTTHSSVTVESNKCMCECNLRWLIDMPFLESFVFSNILKIHVMLSSHLNVTKDCDIGITGL